MQIGGIYIFAYGPTRKQINSGAYGGQDMLPLLILTKKFGTGMLGVNVRGIPDKGLRIRMLERYKDAYDTDDLEKRLAGLMLISRIVQSQPPLKPAYKFFEFSSIRGRKIIKLTVEELEYAITRIP